MSKYKYSPDYSALYPGVEISGKILSALKESDRKMKYTEYDLKCERFIVDEKTGVNTFLPSREDSLERLLEGAKQFRDESVSPEELVTEALYIQELRQCLGLLDADELELIHLLFYDGHTEQEYAQMLGITQQAINKRRHKVLEKIKNIMEGQFPGC